MTSSNPSDPTSLRSLMSGMAGMVISQTMQKLAIDNDCLDRVGRAMYEDEAEEAISKPWHTLPIAQRKVWQGRARVAILGLLAFAQKK